MTKRQRNIYVLVFTSLLLLSMPFVFDFSSKKVIPFDKPSAYFFATYHEPKIVDFSVATVTKDTLGALHLKYKLSSTKDDPFVGFYLRKKDSLAMLLSLNDYNAIKIHVKAKKAKRIPITFTLDYKGFTSPNKELSSMPFTYELLYEGEKDYVIAVKDFVSPSWWYRAHRKTDADFNQPDFSRVNYFIVGSCLVIGGGKEDEIEISSLELVNDNFAVCIGYAISALLGYSIYWIMILLSRKKKVLVPFVANDIKGDTKDKTGLIVQFLSKNYSNPDLSQMEVQRELGISAREIGQLLKEGHHSSFKNYLNQIRLAEVKRLLKESDLPISDIAYKSGYNNISHFNRVFKSELGLSPKQFREQP